MAKTGWTAWEKVPGFDFEEILYEKKWRTHGGGVGRVSFNRPHKMNSFTNRGIEEMAVALNDLSKDDTVGVGVLTGVGENFGTGGDVSWEASGGLEIQFLKGGAPNTALRLCRKPLIAAVKGYCIGGSHHIAYFCDFSVASDNSIFGQTGPRVGSPAQGFIISYLTMVVGAKKAREIWMLCRQYTAQEALQMGLVNTVVPLEKLDEEVDKWCDELLDRCPSILIMQKASFDAIMDNLDGDFGRYLCRMAPDFFDSEEPTEAQAAYFEKRRPNFWQNRLPEQLKNK
ncbi:MAG: enoyl-CoA hydratase/isomerase family protein [Candidatus Tectomicrobia bacterium]|uniref:Enoyl-CoA hydratase/isomerase family protein n=1 Tax=Tectimicrobiota bacterium TaxID=2528274 RepID=A0A932CM92_UNCTE|nr:enoyl-CoA hydratase/isomerase family protein [Candidatus Tectomicrobia bacterium]